MWLKLTVRLNAQTIEYNSLNYCLNVLKLLASVDSVYSQTCSACRFSLSSLSLWGLQMVNDNWGCVSF